jgi:hypothetical protein
MEQSNQKACLECNEIIRGRSDKKFCCDQCRNTFNNRCSQESNGFIRVVNHILRRNRKILEELVSGQFARVSRRRLYEKGFNFEFTTSTLETKDGKVYYFCYEFGYLSSAEDFLQLIKRNHDSDEWQG